MQFRVCQLLVLLGVAVLQASAAECDCSHFPFKPESCQKTCGGSVLNNASQKDLIGMLGLKKATTDSVVKYRKNHPLTSIDDLSIEPDKKDEIEEQFRNLGSSEGRKLAQKYGSNEGQNAAKKNGSKKVTDAK